MPFTTGGIAAEMSRFDKLARGADDACKRAVKAGGKLLAEKLREAAPVDTGALRKSIKAGPVTYNAGDGYCCEVAPVGNHPKTGEPLAKIGNILEYGRSSSAKRRKYKCNAPKGKTSTMAARGWFNPTVKAAEGEVLAAMQAELDKRMGAVK